MKKIKLFIVILFLGLKSYSQSPEILIELNFEGMPINVTNKIEVKIISGIDTIRLKTTENGFFMPDSLIKKNKTIILSLDKYELIFENILMVWNPLLPKWIINIDCRPIADENKWLLKTAKNNVKWLYSLTNGTGSLLTVFRYKKFKYLLSKPHVRDRAISPQQGRSRPQRGLVAIARPDLRSTHALLSTNAKGGSRPK